MSALFEDSPRRLKHVTHRKGVGESALTLMHMYFDVFFIYNIAVVVHCGPWMNLKLKKFDYFFI